MSKCPYFDVEEYRKKNPGHKGYDYKPCDDICPRYQEPCKRWRLCIIGLSVKGEEYGR